MDERVNAFKVWAPDNVCWANWAKPVLFSSVPKNWKGYVEMPTSNWLVNLESDTIIIVDLPGGQSIAEGLTLAEIGYRPVPLFNGVRGPRGAEIVDVETIAIGLFQGVDFLRSQPISPAAPPAFLLDYNRMNGMAKQPGKFDNRWAIFPQDMPSANYLKEKGIHKVIVLTTRINNDLAHILLRYQKQGLKIFWQSSEEPSSLKALQVSKPLGFGSIFYRFQVLAGLRRNSTGGFGTLIPEVSEGRRYYMG